MGEMADFALEEVEVMESLRDDYARGDMSNQDAFEHGFIDPSGAYEEGMAQSLERVADEPFTAEDMQKECEMLSLMLDQREERYQKPNIVIPDYSKYAKKWSMMKGMKDHVLKGFILSDKQKSWLSTNITFDVEDFAEVCHNNPSFRKKIDLLKELTGG